jgi:two-component sensor histidine kinase
MSEWASPMDRALSEDAPRARWPRELLAVLLMAPPILGLVFEPDGMRHELLHQARSLLAIWIYTLCLGLGLQVLTDALVSRWPRVLEGGWGALRHVAITVVMVVVLTGILERPLAWTCPGLDGRIDTLLLRGILLSVLYVLLGRLYQSFLRVREEGVASRARAAQQLAEARYAALMARTQPHFLHNALTAAAGLVPTDPAAAERILRDLGSLFREIVTGSDKRTIRAADELATVRRYLEIQELRFAPRLSVVIDDEALAADELVPPLVLLPFVENAVLHGLSDGGSTRVSVALALEADHVLFTVRDDGPGVGSSRHEDGAHIGTQDVRARLATLYGTDASVVTRPAQPGAARPGFVVEVRIPREDG